MYRNKNLYRTLWGFLSALLFIFTVTSCECYRKKQEELEKQQSMQVNEVGRVIEGTFDPVTGNFIYATGDIFTIKLPNGKEIVEVGNHSTEANLFNFLNDSNTNVNEDKRKGWITLDRVYFDSGKSTVTTESGKQIKNISEILKAFPNAKIKIGGYTDTTGTEETNRKVSEERAKTVQEELIKSGIQAERITSEGYGSQHPVCEANDAPECKAKNRRVDIRVFEK